MNPVLSRSDMLLGLKIHFTFDKNYNKGARESSEFSQDRTYG
jgi:hypothetical protein